MTAHGEGRSGSDAAQLGHDGEGVVDFSVTVVVGPLAVAHAPEVEARPGHLVPDLVREDLGQRERNGAVHAPAVQRMRMADEDGALRSRRGVDAGCEGRTVVGEAGDAHVDLTGDRDGRRTYGLGWRRG